MSYLNEFYKNVKTGNLYELLFYAIDATNIRGEGYQVAVYARSDGTGPYCVREKNEFHQKFERVKVGGE